jgi:hypothetical protein
MKNPLLPALLGIIGTRGDTISRRTSSGSARLPEIAIQAIVVVQYPAVWWHRTELVQAVKRL